MAAILSWLIYHSSLWCWLIINETTPHLAKGSLTGNVHYNDVLTMAMASQITGVSIVCSTVCSGADQRKHQSSTSLAFVGGIHRWPVNSPHKGPVIWKMFPFDDVIMYRYHSLQSSAFTHLKILHLPGANELRLHMYCCLPWSLILLVPLL